MPALLAEANDRRSAVSADAVEQTISVLIVAKDPASHAAVERKLLGVADITVLTPTARRHPDVAVVVADSVDAEVLGWIRTIRRHSLSRIVVVVASVGATATAAAAAADAGANGLLPRALADGPRLAWVIRKVRHGDSVTLVVADEIAAPAPNVTQPPQPHEPPEKGSPMVSDRDREVLRLLAEGCDTSEIARALAYSEPTIKNAIQRLFDQLKAKNRPHAVALALRSGII
jgi:DNA-binding NarL/FixJ family response regulator